MCLKLDPYAADSCFLTTECAPAVEMLKFLGGQSPDAAVQLRYSAEGGREVAEDTPSPFSILLTSSSTEPPHALEQSPGSGVP